MAIALDPGNTWDYVLKSDRKLPVEQQTTWHLRTLSQRGMMQIVDHMSFRSDGEHVSTTGIGTQSLDIVADGIVGWTNLLDTGGQPILAEVRNGRLTEESLSRIPTNAILELALSIESGARMTEDDVEKPAPSPTA